MRRPGRRSPLPSLSSGMPEPAAPGGELGAGVSSFARERGSEGNPSPSLGGALPPLGCADPKRRSPASEPHLLASERRKRVTELRSLVTCVRLRGSERRSLASELHLLASERRKCVTELRSLITYARLRGSERRSPASELHLLASERGKRATELRSPHGGMAQPRIRAKRVEEGLERSCTESSRLGLDAVQERQRPGQWFGRSRTNRAGWTGLEIPRTSIMLHHDVTDRAKTARTRCTPVAPRIKAKKARVVT
jgi:hypothetical protein